MRPKIVVAGVLAALLLIVVLQNTEVVTVSFLFWEMRMSRVLLILLAAVAGFIGGYLIATLRRGLDRPGPPTVTAGPPA